MVKLASPASDRERAVVRARGGLKIEVFLDDEAGRCLDLFGECDRRITWACRRILRPGDTYIDVGANYGLESLVAARAVGPGGVVHAFEPQPQLAEMLRNSAAHNGLTNLHVHGVALSDADAVMTLHVPIHHSGGASLVRLDGGETRAYEVPVRQTAGCLQELGVGPIRLLKIDVEGHEPAVLAGAAAVFRATPPDAVLFESNDWYAGIPRGKTEAETSFADQPTIRFLREHGYRFYAFGRSLLRVNLFPVSADEPRHPPVSDFLAVHNDRLGELARRCGVPAA